MMTELNLGGRANEEAAWHISLDAEASDREDVHRRLVLLHTQGEIRLGDTITGFKSSALTNLSYLGEMFHGEYAAELHPGPGGRQGLSLTRVGPTLDANILNCLPDSPEVLEAELEAFGHVLIRTGMPVDETRLIALMSARGPLMDYNRYGTTPRRPIQDSQAVQVTPWASEVLLPGHNELTHHLEFPWVMAFICHAPSAHGGETVIYDCARAFEGLSPEMRARVLAEDVICHKRYVESTSDLRRISWRQVVGADATQDDAIRHFKALGYGVRVLIDEEDGTPVEVLDVSVQRPLAFMHRGRLCLHASMVPLTPYWYWQIWPGKTPPLRVTWMNGELLDYETFSTLDTALLRSRIQYGGWQPHDVLIVDNPRVAHGRLPHIGPRHMGGLMAVPAHFQRGIRGWETHINKGEATHEEGTSC